MEHSGWKDRVEEFARREAEQILTQRADELSRRHDELTVARMGARDAAEAARRIEEEREEKMLKRALRTPAGVEAFLEGKVPPSPEQILRKKEARDDARAYGPMGKMGRARDLYRDSLMRGKRHG